jgi:hypothetical protein
MFVRYRSIGLAILFLAAAQAHASDPSPLWGRLANPPFANERIRTTLFFSGQASDGSNPYGIADPPGSRLFLYTAHPADDRHLRWSESAANRDFALSQMVSAGINVVTMSSWGESFLDSRPRPPWAVYAPMQTSPGSHDELFTAAVGKPLLVTPFIESRGDWNLRNEFPSTQGSVAPGAVSQVVDLVNRYLTNSSHPEWADQWTRVYDRDGQERYAVVFIHASSNQLGPDDHAAYAQGFDTMAEEVFARTGVKVGFFLDVLPRNSFAPGDFKPTPEQTGPELFAKDSILGLQNFIPEIWAGVPNEAARLDWKRDFSSRWAATGIPFLMDVAPGYDAHIVFPGSPQYGHNQAWLDGLTAQVQDFGQDGLVFNSWNGYTEAMQAVATSEYGDAYYQWLRALSLIHEQWRWIGNIGAFALGSNWNHGKPTADSHAVLDNGGTIRVNTIESVKLFDIGTGKGLGGTIEIVGGGALTVEAGDFRLGQGEGSVANLTMTGGSLNIAGNFVSAAGGATELAAKAQATINHSGGTINAERMFLSERGQTEYNLSGSGEINVRRRLVLGQLAPGGVPSQATFTQSGGTVNVDTANLAVGDVGLLIGERGHGTYELLGGVLNVPETMWMGQWPASSAHMEVSGGTANIGRDVGVSLQGDATLTQLGGVMNIGRSLLISNGNLSGTATGTYEISGGELNVEADLVVGFFNGNGRLNVIGAEGQITVGNNYFQDPNARLFVQPDSAGQLSPIDVAGNALFQAGTVLEANFDNFIYRPGQSWDVLTAATIDDHGLSIVAPAGVDWRIISDAGGQVLQLFVPGLSGDYNGDSVVDAADYVVWRRGLADGTMNASDYDAWKMNFGATLGAAAAKASGTLHAAVPEPGTLILLSIGLAAVACHQGVTLNARPACLAAALRFPPGR